MTMKTKPKDQNRPIGFMDSGVGGISVLKEAVKVLPREDFIYYGDSANAPYGTKSSKEIKELTFKAVDVLMGYDIKALVVACNTATSSAIRDLRVKFPEMPIIGIEPAVKPAVVCLSSRQTDREPHSHHRAHQPE